MGSYIVERNGLGIVRVQQGKRVYWKIEHIASGAPLSGYIGWCGNRGRWPLRDVKAAFNALADAFPWQEWTDPASPPPWGGEACRAVREQEQMKMKGY